jgi:hypothetical protein
MPSSELDQLRAVVGERIAACKSLGYDEAARQLERIEREIDRLSSPPRVPEDEAEGALPQPCGNCGRPRWECACGEVRVPVEARDHDVMPSEFDASHREKPEISGHEGER